MKEIFIITQQQYEEVSKRLEELKNAPAHSFEAKELKALTKSLIQYERRMPSSDSKYKR